MLGYAYRRINLQTEPAQLGGEMSGKRLLLAVLSCATIMAVSAVAQDEKNEVGGTFGHAFISDQGISGASFFNPVIHSGSGWSFDVEYSRRSAGNPASLSLRRSAADV